MFSSDLLSEVVAVASCAFIVLSIHVSNVLFDELSLVFSFVITSEEGLELQLSLVSLLVVSKSRKLFILTIKNLFLKKVKKNWKTLGYIVWQHFSFSYFLKYNIFTYKE